MTINDRRQFLKQSGLAAAGLAFAGAESVFAAPKMPFEISLAEWSLHKAFFKKEVDNINFAKVADGSAKVRTHPSGHQQKLGGSWASGKA